MTPQEILALPMGANDIDAATVRDYLKELLTVLWQEEESFSGKRPFGNSGWQYEVYAALEKAGAVAKDDTGMAQALILEAIDIL